jgi:hypothetical protein
MLIGRVHLKKGYSVYFTLLITLLAGMGGLYFGAVGLRDYSRITISANSVSLRQIIKISAYLGIASTLIFFVIITSMSIFDEKYVWSLQKFGGAVLIALIPGFVVTLGGLYQVYTTVKFRDLLIKKQKEKAKKSNG